MTELGQQGPGLVPARGDQRPEGSPQAVAAPGTVRRLRNAAEPCAGRDLLSRHGGSLVPGRASVPIHDQKKLRTSAAMLCREHELILRHVRARGGTGHEVEHTEGFGL